MATPTNQSAPNVIGEKSFFEGKFLVNGTLQINGKFEGSIIKVEQLNVGRTGKVKSNIEAGLVKIDGVVIGNIKAAVRVMLQPTARVLGDIVTPELLINNGVILEGKVLISNNLNITAKDSIMKDYNKED